MKSFVFYFITLFTFLTLTGCEVYPDGRYVDPGQLIGLPWVEKWYDSNDNYREHAIRFNYGNGYEKITTGSYVEEYYFTWEWMDDITLILYYENGEYLHFDIYELSSFRLYGRLGEDVVDFST